MERVLVDTDIIIDLSHGIEGARDYVNHYVRSGNTLYISSVTVMEVLVGARNQQELRSLAGLLQVFAHLKLNEEISDGGIRLIHTYRAHAHLAIPDLLIAATALVYGFPLCTNNVKHFEMIENLEVMKPY